MKSEPIAIVSRELGDKPFLNDTQVIAGPDWLRELTLGVKNISNKTIKSFEINLGIEKSGYVLLLRFPLPPNEILNPDGKSTGVYEPLKTLKPGETIKLKIPEWQLVPILENVKKEGLTDIDHVTMSFELLSFDDHTGWYQGMDMREDPIGSRQWIPVPRK